MSVDDAIKLFQTAFQILSQRIVGKNYAVRFFGAPYTDAALSLLVYTDSRNPEHISAPSILGVMWKHKITEAAFREAYNEFYGQLKPRRVK
jgi:hypothetical protein